MNYSKPAGVLGAGAAVNGALAFTGFSALLWAELALMLIVAGLVLIRVTKMRRLGHGNGDGD